MGFRRNVNRVLAGLLVVWPVAAAAEDPGWQGRPPSTLLGAPEPMEGAAEQVSPWDVEVYRGDQLLLQGSWTPEEGQPRWDPQLRPASSFLRQQLDWLQEVPVPPDVLPLPHFYRAAGLTQERRFSVDYVFMGRAGVDAPATDVLMNQIATAYRHEVRLADRYLLTLRPFYDMVFFSGPGGIDIPDQVYTVAIELQGDIHINEQFGLSLGFTPGFWTDFVQVNEHDVRLPARVLGTARISENLVAAAGVEFTDNIRGNLLPAGGLLWRINDRTELELMYPRSRLVYYWHQALSFYLVAERISTTWHIRSVAGDEDFEYRDLHVLLGTQFEAWRRAGLFLEVGGTLNRRFRFDAQPDVGVDSTFMLRAGTRF